MSLLSFNIEALHKKFAAQVVLKDLSLRLNGGELCLLLGANGVGKSTLLRICSGLLPVEQGKVDSCPMAQLGYLGHHSQLYACLTGEENLQFIKQVMRLEVEIDHFLADWNLTDLRQQRVDTLSRGMQARVALARTLLHAPQYIFLDEPSSALDDRSFTIFISQLSARIQSGAVCLLASHDATRFKPYLNRVVQLAEGRICADSKQLGSIQSVFDGYTHANR